MNWISAASGLFRGLLLMPLLFAPSAQAQDATPFGNEQLDQLTAQIALYPDSLLAQLLMATTYPEDFAAAAAWSKRPACSRRSRSASSTPVIRATCS